MLHARSEKVKESLGSDWSHGFKLFHKWKPIEVNEIWIYELNQGWPIYEAN